MIESQEDYIYRRLDEARNNRQDAVYATLGAFRSANRREFERLLERRFAQEWTSAVEQAYIEGEPIPVENRPTWALTAEEAARVSDDALDEAFRNSHREAVLTALREGKPVPPQVLADVAVEVKR